MTDPIDHQRLLAEIDEEVRRRRAAGDIPADLEHELDVLFARHIPAMSFEATFDQVLDRIESTANINTHAPTTSTRPGVPQLKKTIQRSVLWMFDHVAQQVTSFAEASTRALRLLGERVDALERSVAVPVVHDGAAVAVDTDHWSATVPGLLAGVRGRVAVMEAGDGALLAALVAAGVDAYGVEPDPTRAQDAIGRDLEVRNDDAASHLRRVDDGALAAVVLVGGVEALPSNMKLSLVQLVARKLQPDGRIVVVGSDPSAWAAANPVAADLAPGRPFHAETWVEVLEGHGFGADVHRGASSYAISAHR